MITDEIMEALDQFKQQCSERGLDVAALNAAIEMLGDYDESTWLSKCEEQNQAWLKQFVPQHEQKPVIKKTGIIRRIDDLGRLVFTKELRRTLHVHEGDPFELSVMEIDGVASLVATPYRPATVLDKEIVREALRNIAKMMPTGTMLAMFDHVGEMGTAAGMSGTSKKDVSFFLHFPLYKHTKAIYEDSRMAFFPKMKEDAPKPREMHIKEESKYLEVFSRPIYEGEDMIACVSLFSRPDLITDQQKELFTMGVNVLQSVCFV